MSNETPARILAALRYPYLKWLRHMNRNKKPSGLNRSLIEQPLARASTADHGDMQLVLGPE